MAPERAGSRRALDALNFCNAGIQTGLGPFMSVFFNSAPDRVNQYFNDSTGKGDYGDDDMPGLSNQGGGWQFVFRPAFPGLENVEEGARTSHGASGARKSF